MLLEGQNSMSRRHFVAPAVKLTVLISWLLVTAGLILSFIFFNNLYRTYQTQKQLRQTGVISQDLPSMDQNKNTAFSPITLRIPAIGINAPVDPVGLAPDLSLQIPAASDRVGWFKNSSMPGENGPVVFTGHLDSFMGAAIFWNLKKLKQGDEIEVYRRDGNLIKYQVTALEKYSQDNFPTQTVYGAQNYPVLRLITCAGTYQKSLGRYSENLVVFAKLKT